MAEMLFRAHVSSSGVHVHSAGIAALVGEPVSEEVLHLMSNNHATSSHRARQITLRMVQKADLILVMQREQQSDINRITPAARGRVHLLGKWQGIEIPDPHRKSSEYFEQVFQLISESVEEWSKRIWTTGTTGETTYE
ncbi:hypothetical protein JYT48_01060 [Mariprofundus ferrooxydans]|nr:hypothetical protein [Mariprofundus ferrooxydans]